MGYTASLAELRRAGVVLAADEAVAVAQKLIQQPPDLPPIPPFGPPSLGNVRISGDGSVVCRACEITPGVAEIAILLQGMLATTPQVPGGLRYALARALHEVDAPPFDSIEEFSATLARYEPADCDEAVRGVIARADRRRTRRSSADLHRQLREADRRLYETRGVRPPEQGGHRRRKWIVGFVVAGALTTIAAAGFISDRAPAYPAAPPSPFLRSPAPVEEASPRDAQPQFAARSVHHVRAHPKRPVRATATAPGHARYLRLRWLHKTIAIRDDLAKP